MSIKYISNSDVLGTLYVGYEIKIDGYCFTSIASAFWYLILRVHGKKYEANHLAHNVSIMRHPNHIQGYVDSLHFQPSADWIFVYDRVYYAIMFYLLENADNRFHQEFVKISKENPDKDVSFALTNGNKEFVWSSGLRKSSSIAEKEGFQGFNVYGNLLSLAFSRWCSGRFGMKFRVSDMVALADKAAEAPGRLVKMSSNGSLSVEATDSTSADGVRHTVLLLSDSQCRQMQSINNGMVIKVGGGKYHTIAQEITKQRINLAKFKVIVVFCGVNNCRQFDRKAWRASWKHLERILSTLPTDCQIIINSPIWNPKANFVYEHAQWMKNELTTALANAYFCDWSTTANNPFVTLGTRNTINRKLYNNDNFHVSHTGVRELWIRWVSLIPEMALVPYKISVEWYLSKADPVPKNKKIYPEVSFA